MHKPITSRDRSIVDGSLVHCHGRSEFESRHRPCVFGFFFRFFLFFFCVVFFDYIFLLIYLFIDIIHYNFQTISVDKHRFNDCIPY